MYFPEDEHIARQMQCELNSDQLYTIQKENLNPIDNNLELADPTPSIHDLFVRFNKKFFWGSLDMVQVLWSNRMTRCAGLCYFEGRHGLCKISLSAPLLSLRPRKDLVETLLHEMIHAYLFVTNNYSDRDDHGPEFHKHMYRINREAGTNISVYHTFYDEVEYYKRHIWRCNGTCRFKKPYFGFVKRTMNRPPGPADTWWKQHKLQCNGTFIKISEPDKPKRQTAKIKKQKGTSKFKDIRDLFQSQTVGRCKEKSNVKTYADLIFNLEDTDKKLKGNFEKDEIKHKEVTNGTQEETSKKDISIMKHTNAQMNDPKSLGESRDVNWPLVGNVGSKTIGNYMSPRDAVRSVWSKKFSQDSVEKEPLPKEKNCASNYMNKDEQVNQTRKSEGSGNENIKQEINVEEFKQCPVCSKAILTDQVNNHLESCIDFNIANDEINEDDENEITCDSVPCPCCYKWFLESKRKRQPLGSDGHNNINLKNKKSWNKKGKPEKAKKRIANEEIDSDLEDDLSLQNDYKYSSESEVEETVQEKRLRLARTYLEEIEKEEQKRLETEDVDKDVITQRLKEDALEKAGKLRKNVADLYSCCGDYLVLKCKEHSRSITCLAVSNDNQFLFSASDDFNIVKWSVKYREKKFVIKRTDAHGHKRKILTLAVSCDSHFLASGGLEPIIKIWNADDLTYIHSFNGHKIDVTGLAFRKNTHQLFSCSSDKSVKIWNLDDMTYVETLYGHSNGITSIDALARDRAVTSGGRDSSLRIWKVPEESHLVLNGHKESIDCVKLLNENNCISGSDNGNVCLWSSLKKKPVFTLAAAHGLNPASNTPNWISFEKCLEAQVDGNINCMLFTNDGRYLIVGVGQEHRIGRWHSKKNVKNAIFLIPLLKKNS
ncbi:hypothetical protein RUM43_011609 [Polyplax serrata]|uniref:SprT-like domain-containing protein n=1 Tax=Polyplax serrata TaxID=468196 RepID=A0AAN8RTP6_POLSC